MSIFWGYFWFPIAAGIVVGIIVGMIAVRVRIERVRERPHEPDFIPVTKRRRWIALAGGVAASIILAVSWHGPLGAGDRLSTEIETTARNVLDYYEMTQINAQLHHGPLTRRLVLSGKADDFQTSELVRIMGQISGVSSVHWTEQNAGVPLIVEGSAVALLGFLLGMLIAYLRERRRRYNAYWNW